MSPRDHSSKPRTNREQTAAHAGGEWIRPMGEDLSARRDSSSGCGRAPKRTGPAPKKRGQHQIRWSESGWGEAECRPLHATRWAQDPAPARIPEVPQEHARRLIFPGPRRTVGEGTCFQGARGPVDSAGRAMVPRGKAHRECRYPPSQGRLVRSLAPGRHQPAPGPGHRPAPARRTRRARERAETRPTSSRRTSTSASRRTIPGRRRTGTSSPSSGPVMSTACGSSSTS